jgi:hypothetical protein
MATGLSRQSHTPEDCLSLYQAVFEVRQSASEPLSVRAMDLDSGFGECSKGVPVEGEADG